MRKYRPRYFLEILVACTLLVAVGIVSASQQERVRHKPLSPQAQLLKEALQALQANPNDTRVQKQYLERFPKDFESFMRLFAPKDFSELYDGAEYIFALRTLIPSHPLVVGEILVGLGKDAHWEADAPNYLQMVTAQFAVSETSTFAKILRRCSAEDVSTLIRFLADKENHAAYEEYPLIAKNLRQLGDEDLAKLFEQAKAERMKQKDH